eukprot:86413-Rhodomonas_salina.1
MPRTCPPGLLNRYLHRHPPPLTTPHTPAPRHAHAPTVTAAEDVRERSEAWSGAAGSGEGRGGERRAGRERREKRARRGEGQ